MLENCENIIYCPSYVDVIHVYQDTFEYFKENSIVLENGQEIEADAVIYATGFVKEYDIFDEETTNALDR